ncbi:response regulator containing CheY-like receiver domain and AraC-type DNA-binding domain [Anaerolinea thermolimosa]|uniref:response regulator n=1 Tax=Anaerolinea thermolimosa TaxID=229919 RepID=UPI0007808111|nr:response regulator [Anaerolinea thermolimosa]GAP07000.1 response regulator containing CheY-like receiver domain and AraC-type DNA-binding domain [Anaerolinea thermolimosa]
MPPQERIRVLIVDDIAETRENIRRMLQFDANIEVVGAARTGREAIEEAQQNKPDVIIMDINMPDMDGITATQEIKRKLPFCQVVILSVQSDPSYMRRAMLAGARDFLTKPPMIDELTDAIRRAGALAQEEKKKTAQAFPVISPEGGTPAAPQVISLGKVITVYSPKGGTGCTTLATNLAIAFKTEDRRVALIDANLQYGDVAVFLNEQGKNTVLDLALRADELDPDIVQEVMVTHRASGVDVLAAPSRPELADKINGEQFAKLIEYLRRIYNYIIIDSATFLTDVVQSALDVATVIVLVTTQDIPSIKNCNLFLTLADAVGLKRERIMFVMNRYDKRVAITPERVGESLRQPIVTAIPFDEKIPVNAVNRGIPFMLDNRTQPIGKSILAMADLIKERIQKLELAELENPKT